MRTLNYDVINYAGKCIVTLDTPNEEGVMETWLHFGGYIDTMGACAKNANQHIAQQLSQDKTIRFKEFALPGGKQAFFLNLHDIDKLSFRLIHHREASRDLNEQISALMFASEIEKQPDAKEEEICNNDPVAGMNEVPDSPLSQEGLAIRVYQLEQLLEEVKPILQNFNERLTAIENSGATGEYSNVLFKSVKDAGLSISIS